MPQTTNISLGEAQEIFSECLGKLLVWIPTNPGWKCRLGEGFVGLTDGKDGDYDGPHKKGGNHYRSLAQDINLFIDGEWIKDGSHSAWKAIADYWESLHPLCKTGIGFQDPNHIGFNFQGRI